MQGYTIGELSRLSLKSVNANYTYTTSSSFHAQGVFRKIDQQLANEDLYISSIRKKDFFAMIDLKSTNAGLRSETSFELETLIKSFCLAKNELRTFLPYPLFDPAIVGICSIANLPVVLLKDGVDVTNNELMNDLLAVYVEDKMMPKRQLVIMKVISVSLNNVQTFRGMQEEYTNGVSKLFYDMCINRSSLAQSNEFCRRTRLGENTTEEKSAEYEMTKEFMISEEIFQKITIFREMIQRHMRQVESSPSVLVHGRQKYRR
uniref:Uncharacterized protein n=1 Tax=Romanomermis culicivorax TaxID=13658 RepID=A0A915J4V7_ROMCU